MNQRKGVIIAVSRSGACESYMRQAIAVSRLWNIVDPRDLPLRMTDACGLEGANGFTEKPSNSVFSM